MGLKAIPMRADTGPIGGDLSHEFIILAETGESAVFCHKGLVDKDILSRKIDFDVGPAGHRERWTSLYAATDEMHDEAKAFEALPEGARLAARGIEVGHIFYFGTKYSKPMGAVVAGPGRRADHGRDGLLRHRRLAPGRRHHRGQPRRCRHRLAGRGGALQGGDRQPEAR
jgi:prolyl-tRNA synthetase